MEYLSAFTQRLKVIAQHHGIKSEFLCSKLMDELEQLDEGLGLDTMIKAKKQELHRIENTIFKAKEETARISSTNKTLRQERSGLKAALLEERRHITKDIKTINATANSMITQLKQDLGASVRGSVIEVNKLKNQALQLGKELG